MESTGWRVLISKEALCFLAGVLVLCGVGFFLAALATPEISTPPQLLLVTMVSILSAWLGISISLAEESGKLLIPTVFIVFLLAWPVAGQMIVADPSDAPGLFWWNTAVLGLLLVAISLSESNSLSRWDKVLLGFTLGWMFLHLFTFLSTLKWSPTAPALEDHLVKVRFVLDIRHSLGLVSGTLLAGTAVVQALQRPLPDLLRLRPWRLTVPSGDSLARAALIPIIVLLNVVLLAAHGTTELLLRAAFLTVIFFGRIGQELVSTAWAVLSDKTAWVAAVKFALVVCVFFGAVFLSISMSEGVYEYLQSDSLKSQAVSLFGATLHTFAALLCLCIIVSQLVRPLPAAAGTIGGLAWIIMAVFVAGILLHASRRLGLEVPWFGRLGLFSWIVLLLVILGAVHALASPRTKVRKERGDATADSQKHPGARVEKESPDGGRSW